MMSNVTEKIESVIALKKVRRITLMKRANNRQQQPFIGRKSKKGNRVDTTLTIIIFYVLGVVTGFLINSRKNKIEVIIKRESLSPKAEPKASTDISPSVVHLTPEREANFARTKKESEGDL
jgi:hypothetical protein